MSNQPISQADAFARFPELAHLVELRGHGWAFYTLGEGDRLVGVAASYSQAQYTDALFVFDRHHVVANRIVADDYGGGLVWFKEGTDIQEMVDDLLHLPAPGEPGAPSLVTKASSLWTP